MKKLVRTACAVAVATGAVLALGTTASQADVYGTTSSPLNGNIYFTGSAGTCGIGGSQNLGACTNKVTSIVQRGYTTYKPNARLYWGSNFTGAYACMTPGSTWKQSSSGPHITFDHGSGSGLHESVWNNIASVQWTSTPC